MLKATTRLLSICLNRTVVLPKVSVPVLNTTFSFCTGKHNKHENDKNHKHQEGHQKHHNKDNSDTAHESKEDSVKEKHHEHGPGCKHDHGHHHETHQHHHQHGPGCNHNHDHDHHAAHPNVKLSKLTFDELIELNTDQSLKYAHMIYEQQHKKLKELAEEKQNLAKNIEFYKKIDQQIKEKEKKLEDNISMYQQEAALSSRRAEKEVEESKSFAVTKIAKELLEVADCISSCKKYALEQEKQDKYTELIISSHELVKEILKGFQIEQFDPTNKEYDPNFQESLLQIPVMPGCKAGYVATTMRTGYLIKGRLLRSARVGVFN